MRNILRTFLFSCIFFNIVAGTLLFWIGHPGMATFQLVLAGTTILVKDALEEKGVL